MSHMIAPYEIQKAYKIVKNNLMLTMKSFFILFVLEGTFGWRIGTPQVFKLYFIIIT